MAASKLLAWTTALIAGVLAYFSLVLSANISIQYLWLLAAAAAFGLLSRSLFVRLEHEKLLARLGSLWGSKGEIEKRRDFSEIDDYFRLVSVPNAGFVIDDRTWEDLNGNLVFARIDRTLTAYGQQYLYALLRTPVFSEGELERRSALIGLFQAEPGIREKVQTILAKVGRDDAHRAISFLIDPPQISGLSFGWLHNLLAFLPPQASCRLLSRLNCRLQPLSRYLSRTCLSTIGCRRKSRGTFTWSGTAEARVFWQETCVGRSRSIGLIQCQA